MPVLLRALRTHGQHAELQCDAWRLLLAMGRAQPYLRRLIVDGGAMGLLLSALSAHQTDERAHLTHLLAVRALLSSFSPKAFVEASGVELLCEAVLQRPTSLAHAEAAAGSLHMLSGVNNVVRRKVINARVLPPLLALLGGAAAGRPSTHETVLGMLVQLLKVDDEYSRESLVEQAAVDAVVASLAALPPRRRCRPRLPRPRRAPASRRRRAPSSTAAARRRRSRRRRRTPTSLRWCRRRPTCSRRPSSSSAAL